MYTVDILSVYVKMMIWYMWRSENTYIIYIELDDGKIYRKPDQFDGKNHGFRLRFSLKPIH